MSEQKKSMTVVGGGPGGYTAAFASAKAGMAVTLVECAELGGTCLNNGCIPTKTIKSSAEALELAHQAVQFGVKVEGGVSIDPQAVYDRKERVCATLRSGLEKTCAALGVTLVRGKGRLLRGGEVEVTSNGTASTITSDFVILATGSHPVNLPGLVADHKRILTSDDALKLTHVPASIIIVGGGVIGCELACIYQAFGSTVTVVEGQNRILPLPSVDDDISVLLQREMKKRRIACELGQTLTQVRVDEDDPAFLNPTKPIGQFMSFEEAQNAEKEYVYVVKEDSGRGYRRVVASPKPVEIIEIDAIRSLVESGQLVIACGGGGIPVMLKGNHLKGASAVIDKDHASCLLAENLDADFLIILTAVEKAAVNFGKPDQKWLSDITVTEAERYIEEGHFAPGSMLPKVQSAVRFASSKKGRTALITLLEKASDGINGKTGTRISL